MRETYHSQLPLMYTNTHVRAAELLEMSAALDMNLEVLEGVHKDLLGGRKTNANQGRKGMSAEQVVRAAIVKQMFTFSYEELSFHLSDSLVLRGFCRLFPSEATPSVPTLIRVCP